jgi:hypothetical protein
MGNLGQDLPFSWDTVGHDAVKGGYPVCGDEQKLISEIKYFTHFAALNLA